MTPVEFEKAKSLQYEIDLLQKSINTAKEMQTPEKYGARVIDFTIKMAIANDGQVDTVKSVFVEECEIQQALIKLLIDKFQDSIDEYKAEFNALLKGGV